MSSTSMCYRQGILFLRGVPYLAVGVAQVLELGRDVVRVEVGQVQDGGDPLRRQVPAHTYQLTLRITYLTYSLVRWVSAPLAS